MVVIPVGGTVEFPNEDPIFHNVFSVSGENRFDLDLYKRPKSGSWTFQHPGVVRVYCNIHPQMSAVVVVRDNPFFAKAAPDGTFAIADVPAGKYTLKAWHERGRRGRARGHGARAEGDVEAALHPGRLDLQARRPQEQVRQGLLRGREVLGAAAMGLTQKILLFTSALVVALVATTLAFTTVQADRLAHATINQGLKETREVWETFQADRYNKLKLGVRVLGNDPAFKAAVRRDRRTRPPSSTR